MAFSKKNPASIIFLLIVIGFLLFGAFSKHEVFKYTRGRRSKKHQPKEVITELELIEDATFGGVRNRFGRLFSTYDRSKPRPRRECPT